MAPRRRLALVLFAVALVSLLHGPISRRVRAAELLLSLSTGGSERAATVLVEQDVVLPGRDGPIRARVYRLAGAGLLPGLVIAHGVHWKGIDERRLVPFARELARAGRVVVTPELRDLTDYRITTQGVGIIADSVSWLSARRDLVASPRVAVMGFSFAGGLSLVAASQPELEGKLEWVTSIGGHHDLERVLRFLVQNEIETPDGLVRSKAHDYGLVVVLYASLEHFVDEPDRETLGDALRLWLHEDRVAALARASQRTTESGERLFRLLEAGELQTLRPELERLMADRRGELLALSPRGKLADVGVPVFLLHGSADSVIPASETEWADRELRDAPHRALVSPLLEHVEVSKDSTLGPKLELLEFMSRLL